MNSPFVQEQARAVASLPKVREQGSQEAKIVALYQKVLSRDPLPEEVDRAVQFLSANPGKNPENAQPIWEQFAQVLLISNELMFVD